MGVRNGKKRGNNGHESHNGIAVGNNFCHRRFIDVGIYGYRELVKDGDRDL